MVGYYTFRSNEILPPNQREAFAATMRETKWCDLCGQRFRATKEHIAYHCTPVECECSDAVPTRAFGECSGCRRPRLR